MAPVKVDRKLIRHFLDERQTSAGGVTGKDLVQFAEHHGLHPVAFRRRVRRLLASDPDFREFKYRGKYTPVIDLAELAQIMLTLQDAPGLMRD